MALLTKTQLAANQLRDDISAGRFADGRLPREVELAKSMKIGRITLRNALDILESEHLVERHRRFGTFVASEERRMSTHGTIGLMMRTVGHVYADIHRELTHQLSERGYATQSVSTSGRDSAKSRPSIDRSAGKLLDSSLAGLVLDGYVCNGFPYLEELKKHHPVFIDFFDSATDCQNTGVWFDYHEVGYLGGKFLMEHGCKHPLLIPHSLPPTVRFSPRAYERHREKQIIEGYRRALREYGMDGDLFILDPFHELEKLDEFLAGLFRKSILTPDGIFGSSDSLVLHFLKVAAEVNGRFPENISLIGNHNTPWSSPESLHPFSTIDLNTATLAQAVVDQLELPYQKRSDIYIKPTLIER